LLALDRRADDALLGRTHGALLLAHRGRALLHGLDDVVIAGATAQIALELLPDRLFGRLRMTLDEVDGAHHHPRRAEPALQPLTFLERRLHRMHRAIRSGETFNRHDLGAIRLCGQDRAGLDGVAVEMDRACAALPGVAADVSPREAQVV